MRFGFKTLLLSSALAVAGLFASTKAEAQIKDGNAARKNGFTYSHMNAQGDSVFQKCQTDTFMRKVPVVKTVTPKAQAPVESREDAEKRRMVRLERDYKWSTLTKAQQDSIVRYEDSVWRNRPKKAPAASSVAQQAPVQKPDFKYVPDDSTSCYTIAIPAVVPTPDTPVTTTFIGPLPEPELVTPTKIVRNRGYVDIGGIAQTPAIGAPESSVGGTQIGGYVQLVSPSVTATGLGSWFRAYALGVVNTGQQEQTSLLNEKGTWEDNWYKTKNKYDRGAPGFVRGGINVGKVFNINAGKKDYSLQLYPFVGGGVQHNFGANVAWVEGDKGTNKDMRVFEKTHLYSQAGLGLYVPFTGPTNKAGQDRKMLPYFTMNASLVKHYNSLGFSRGAGANQVIPDGALDGTPTMNMVTPNQLRGQFNVGFGVSPNWRTKTVQQHNKAYYKPAAPALQGFQQ